MGKLVEYDRLYSNLHRMKAIYLQEVNGVYSGLPNRNRVYFAVFLAVSENTDQSPTAERGLLSFGSRTSARDSECPRGSDA